MLYVQCRCEMWLIASPGVNKNESDYSARSPIMLFVQSNPPALRLSIPFTPLTLEIKSHRRDVQNACTHMNAHTHACTHTHSDSLLEDHTVEFWLLSPGGVTQQTGRVRQWNRAEENGMEWNGMCFLI